MNYEFINEVCYQMAPYLDSGQAEQLRSVLEQCCEKFMIGSSESQQKQSAFDQNLRLIHIFISAKRLEGCSEKTLKYYQNTLRTLNKSLEKSFCDVSTNDLRSYLASYQENHDSGKVTLDNIRRIFSSFFSWLEDEDYIVKSPVRRIHKVKASQVVRETLSDENLETLRDTCTNPRDLAIIDLLISTGIRVGELVRLDRKDINFNDREMVVLGKGDKERLVYFDAKAKVHLEEYLASRNDSNPALFVSIKAPSNRLTISGVERSLSRLGARSNIRHVHPHKFRRTLATMAIEKGMPIEQVQKLLGHTKIDTTLHYAIVNQENVKLSHRKYIC